MDSVKIVAIADAFMAHVLFVRASWKGTNSGAVEGPERIFGAALLFSGARCVLQYIIFPCIWPLIGHMHGNSTGIAAVCDLVALASLIHVLRRLWQSRHPRRWHFVPLMVIVAVAILVFFAYDT